MSASHLFSPKRLIGLGLLVALIVAMVLNTKFLTPEELEATLPKKFNPVETANEIFTKAQSELPAKAAELSEVVPAIQTDLAAAGTTFNAVSPSEGSYIFAVKTTGTVTEASADSLRITVEGVDQTPLIIPLTTAINGTVLRDAMGFRFADAPGQTDYQYVGDELKKLMQAAVQAGVSDPESLKGKQVSVVGVVSVTSTGGGPVAKAKPINVQPISLKEGA